MASPIFVSQSPPGFSFLSFIRGVQLSLIGSFIVITSPKILADTKTLTSLVKVSFLVHIIGHLPLVILSISLGFLKFIYLISSNTATTMVYGLTYIQSHIFNFHAFLTMLFVFVYPNTTKIYHLILSSLSTTTYSRFEKTNYNFLPPNSSTTQPKLHYPVITAFISTLPDIIKPKNTEFTPFFSSFLATYTLDTVLVISATVLSYIPYIGPFIPSLITFQNLAPTTGPLLALFLSFTTFLLPIPHTLLILTTSLTTSLLSRLLIQPYFALLPFSNVQCKRWCSSRSGVLLGFTLPFYILIKSCPLIFTPCIVLIAEGSTAYLLPKISTPPPLLSISGKNDETVGNGTPTSSSARLHDLNKLTEWMESESFSLLERNQLLHDFLADFNGIIP